MLFCCGRIIEPFWCCLYIGHDEAEPIVDIVLCVGWGRINQSIVDIAWDEAKSLTHGIICWSRAIDTRYWGRITDTSTFYGDGIIGRRGGSTRSRHLKSEGYRRTSTLLIVNIPRALCHTILHFKRFTTTRATAKLTIFRVQIKTTNKQAKSHHIFLTEKTKKIHVKKKKKKLARFVKAAQRGSRGAPGRMRSHRSGGDRPITNPTKHATMGGLKILFSFISEQSRAKGTDRTKHHTLLSEVNCYTVFYSSSSPMGQKKKRTGTSYTVCNIKAHTQIL